MKKRLPILIAIGAIAMLFAGCRQSKSPAPTPAPVPDHPAGETGRITGLNFTYDSFSGEEFYLFAHLEGLSDSGGTAQLLKRVGPMNSTGRQKEGEVTLSGEQARTLLDILGRYDLAAWSALPRRGHGASPSRSIVVLSGDAILYDVRWDAVFPETLPPEEDIFYAELYNFFNSIVNETPGWEETRSENLDDPRENPAYAERRVIWFGREVRLVPGTGVSHPDGRYAAIDYEGRDWWVEEGFVGTWTLDTDGPTDGGNNPGDAALSVCADGTAELRLNGETWTGVLADTRYFRDSVGLRLEREGERRNCEVSLPLGESYARIHITCYPGPHPEPQFEPIDVHLLKTE